MNTIIYLPRSPACLSPFPLPLPSSFPSHLSCKGCSSYSPSTCSPFPKISLIQKIQRAQPRLEHRPWLIIIIRSPLLLTNLTPWLYNLFAFRYGIMAKCWQKTPDGRPTFTVLRNELKEMENQHKVKYRGLNFENVTEQHKECHLSGVIVNQARRLPFPLTVKSKLQ